MRTPLGGHVVGHVCINISGQNKTRPLRLVVLLHIMTNEEALRFESVVGGDLGSIEGGDVRQAGDDQMTALLVRVRLQAKGR